MPVSVIVPTIHADDTMLLRCLTSIGDAYEIIVESGGTFAENCNRGAQYATGSILLFLNDDTECPAGWLHPFARAFDDQDVGIAGCRLVYGDGSLQHAGVAFRDNGGLEAYNVKIDLPTRDVAAVTGACMAVRRSTWNELAGFDTAYRNGYEDVDLCLRASAARWKIRYLDDPTVTHHESRSGAPRWTYVRENIARLQEQHGDHHGV